MSELAMSFSNLGRLFRTANANKGRIVRSLASTGRSGFWALADQGIVSIGNFAINFVLAKGFAAQNRIDQNGVFGLLFELMFFLNGVQGALIIYPLTMRGAALDPRGISRLSTISMLLTFLAIPLTGGIVGVTASFQATLMVGIWAAVALGAWQVQETTRRGLMAELRFRDAVWGDAISFLGQAIGVAALWHFNKLNLISIYQVMALTSASAAMVQSMQLKLTPATMTEVTEFAREGWTLGRWVLVGNLSALCTGFLYTANFMYWAGAKDVGIAYAINNLFRLANPLMFSITTLIMPHAARSLKLGGMRAARNSFLKFTALGVLLLTPYLGFLLLFPKLSIQLVCKNDPEYTQYAYIVIIVSLSTAMIYLNQAMGAFLGGVEHSRLAMFSQIVYSASFALIGMPLTALYKFPGAAWGGFISCVLAGAVNLVNVKRVISQTTDAASAARGFEVMPVSPTIDAAAAAATASVSAPRGGE
jgi:O-antigen/teichoic acid export membrane protein